MSGDTPSRAVRWAHAVVNGVDAVTGTFLLSMETIGTERAANGTEAPRLAVFRRATTRAATGVKWSLVAVVIVGILAMCGALAVRSTSQAPAARQTANRAQQTTPAIAAVIRLKCAKGAYRDLPEIQASACGKPSMTARGEVR